MNRLCFFLIVLVCFSGCRHGSAHTDLKEYGWKGKVKMVVKTSYSLSAGENPGSVFAPRNPVSRNTFYFNEEGNIDSTFSEKFDSSGINVTYSTYYQFEHSKKSAWTSYNKNKTKLASGKFIWNADKELTEQVFTSENIMLYQTVTHLDDEYRIADIDSKVYNNNGEMVRHDVQEFHLDKSGDIEFYTTKPASADSAQKAMYDYILRDRTGNPTMLMISKPDRGIRTLVQLEFKYYR